MTIYPSTSSAGVQNGPFRVAAAGSKSKAELAAGFDIALTSALHATKDVTSLPGAGRQEGTSEVISSQVDAQLGMQLQQALGAGAEHAYPSGSFIDISV
jgi:hypothetical protein